MEWKGNEPSSCGAQDRSSLVEGSEMQSNRRSRSRGQQPVFWTVHAPVKQRTQTPKQEVRDEKTRHSTRSVVAKFERTFLLVWMHVRVKNALHAVWVAPKKSDFSHATRSRSSHGPDGSNILKQKSHKFLDWHWTLQWTLQNRGVPCHLF